MTTDIPLFTEQLKQACKLAGARWAVWVARRGAEWEFVCHYGLPKPRQAALAGVLSHPGASAWLAGALNSGRTRSRSPGSLAATLGCRRIFAFASPGLAGGILVGADDLGKTGQGLFRILSLDGPGNEVDLEIRPVEASAPEAGVSSQEASATRETAGPPRRETLEGEGAADPGKIFALLREIASATSWGTESGAIVRQVVARLKLAFHTDQAEVLLLSKDRRFLLEFGSDLQAVPRTQPVDTSLAGYSVEHDCQVRVGDIAQAPRVQGVAQGVCSVMSAPVKASGQIVGVIVVESHEPDRFTIQDEQLLVVIAGFLAWLLENARLNQEHQAQSRNLALIHQVAQEILGLTDVAQIAQVTAELVVEYFGYEFASVLVEDETGQALESLGVSGSMAHLIEHGERFPVDEGIRGKVFQSGESYFSNDTSQDHNYLAIQEWQAGSEMCVPLKDGARTVGVINLERAQKQGFSEEDQQSVEALAGILSSVLVNAYRHQELQSKIAQLQAVRETTLDLIADLELPTLFQRVVHRARELAHAQGAILALVSDEEQVIRVAVAEVPWEMGKDFVIPINQGVTGRMVAGGGTIIVDDYHQWDGQVAEMDNAPFSAIAGVPLKWRGQVMGALLVFDDRPGRVFREEEISLLELLAPKVAVSIRNARLYSDLKQSIESQQLAEQKMLHSARLAALGEMAAGIAHELNNPLMTVEGFVELALDELPAGLPQRQELNIVLGEAQRAQAVVRRLLDFARRGENVRQLTDLNDLVSETISLVQHQAQVGGVEVQIKLWNDLPPIEVDPHQIKQVLVNLAQNALQAMPRGGEMVLRTEQRRVESREWALVSVSDNGEGIPPENLDRIYEPFFTTRPSGKGTGLGLPISYGLVADHGGRLEVESEIGRGSCFTVWLPASTGEKDG